MMWKETEKKNIREMHRHTSELKLGHQPRLHWVKDEIADLLE
jgi:hypothetical protein